LVSSSLNLKSADRPQKFARAAPSAPARRFFFDKRRAPVAPVSSSWLVSTPGDRDLTRFAILDEGIVPRLIK
jgi:hypothetical protein